MHNYMPTQSGVAGTSRDGDLNLSVFSPNHDANVNILGGTAYMLVINIDCHH